MSYELGDLLALIASCETGEQMCDRLELLKHTERATLSREEVERIDQLKHEIFWS